MLAQFILIIAESGLSTRPSRRPFHRLLKEQSICPGLANSRGQLRRLSN